MADFLIAERIEVSVDRPFFFASDSSDKCGGITDADLVPKALLWFPLCKQTVFSLLPSAISG